MHPFELERISDVPLMSQSGSTSLCRAGFKRMRGSTSLASFERRIVSTQKARIKKAVMLRRS